MDEQTDRQTDCSNSSPRPHAYLVFIHPFTTGSQYSTVWYLGLYLGSRILYSSPAASVAPSPPSSIWEGPTPIGLLYKYIEIGPKK